MIRSRRMVRRFEKRRLPEEIVDRILDLARRSPTAGFAQGVDFLVLDTKESIELFWRLTEDPRFPSAMAALLAAVDQGLGGWFFGISHGEDELLAHFGVPSGIRPIGVIGLGYRADDEVPSGSGTTRRRRTHEEQVHRNRW